MLSPPLALLAVLIKRDSHGAVLYKQPRVGRDGELFEMWKFRTMVCEADAMKVGLRERNEAGHGFFKIADDPRITTSGRWLRRLCLDELPQLLNVLRGDMSLVGPRPCIPYETESFEPHHFERFLVPAGMTGLWQVTARARSTFGEALDMDVAYARSWSMRLDLWCLLRTPLQLFNGAKGTA